MARRTSPFPRTDLSVSHAHRIIFKALALAIWVLMMPSGVECSKEVTHFRNPSTAQSTAGLWPLRQGTGRIQFPRMKIRSYPSEAAVDHWTHLPSIPLYSLDGGDCNKRGPRFRNPRQQQGSSPTTFVG